MRFLFRIVLVTALSLGIPTTSPAQLTKGTVGTQAVTVKVGDKFVYLISETKPGRKKVTTKRSTVTETVIDLSANYEMKEGARKLIRDTITGRSVYYLTTPGVSFSMNEPLAVSPLRSAGLWKTYPLEIAKGKSIKLPSSESVVDLGSSKAVTRTSATMSILGREKLKVGKSSYNCVKIRETVTEETHSEILSAPKAIPAAGTIKKTKPKKTVKTATLWYSPELQTLVKYTTTQGRHTFTQTLTKYIPAPEQTAMLESR
jgi:hypothetical protein